MHWCLDPAKLYVIDVNGDGRDDMLCHSNDGTISVALAYQDGSFSTTDLESFWTNDIPWCVGGVFNVGYFDEDGKGDYLCNTGESLVLALSQIQSILFNWV